VHYNPILIGGPTSLIIICVGFPQHELLSYLSSAESGTSRKQRSGKYKMARTRDLTCQKQHMMKAVKQDTGETSKGNIEVKRQKNHAVIYRAGAEHLENGTDM
jgi:hypothetical protein